MNYSENAINVFRNLYYRKNDDGQYLENHPDEVFQRLASIIGKSDQDKLDFFEMMKDGYFRPNTPSMINVGVFENPQTSACFVGAMTDDLKSILNFDFSAALVFASGSGIGGNFGLLRECGASLSSGGNSSGPFAFIRKLAATGDAVKSGGRCLSPEQPVFTNLGIQKIKDLVDKGEFAILSFDRNKGRFTAKKATAYESGEKQLYALETDKGTFHLSYDHPILLLTGEYVSVCNLKEGMSIQPGSVNFGGGGYIRANLYDGNKGKGLFHRMIMQDIFNVDFGKKVVHHLDEKKWNNEFSNLSIFKNNAAHAKLHSVNLIEEGVHPFQLGSFSHAGETNGMHHSSDFYKDPIKVEQYKEKQRAILLKDPNRPHEMQKKSVKFKILNSIYKLINSGFLNHNFESYDEVIKARVAYWGQVGPSKVKQITTFNNHFGNFDNFKKAINENNHAVISIKPLGVSKVYDIEVECTSPNDLSRNDNHNFLICPIGSSGYAGTGIVVHNSRRAALMAMFTDTHPDLLEFITLKNGKDTSLRSMNLSIAITDTFMEAVEDGQMWELYGVVDKKVKSKHKAEDIFSKIAENAYKTGDPGVWFCDRSNEDNGLSAQYGRIEGTNPCAEEPLLPNQSCNLGSINVAKFVKLDGTFDYDAFRKIVRIATIFLDQTIDISGYPTEDFTVMAKNTRPIGLGIMGFADALCLMGIPYNSNEGFQVGEEIARVLNTVAIETSAELGEKYGSFPDFEGNKERTNIIVKKFTGKTFQHMRNCTWTTIAPTGTISISADCSPGMEPLFGITYTKNVSDIGEKWLFVNPIFEKLYSSLNWYKKAINEIADKGGSCQHVDCVPDDVKKVWVTAHDINWHDRLTMQEHLQRNISSAISSTVNLTAEATVGDIKSIYKTAWKKRLKGVTIYRDGSLEGQPVEFKQETKEEKIDLIRNRPKIRNGTTYTMETGHGSIHITINKDLDGNVFELFAAGGKGGNVNAASLEAVGRLSSLALQKGAEITEVSKQLLGISDGRVTWDKLHPDDDRTFSVLSIWDAIGQVLNRFYASNSQAKIDGGKPTLKPKQLEQLRCVDCGADAFMKEGCVFCPNCGSKCS